MSFYETVGLVLAVWLIYSIAFGFLFFRLFDCDDPTRWGC